MGILERPAQLRRAPLQPACVGRPAGGREADEKARGVTPWLSSLNRSRRACTIDATRATAIATTAVIAAIAIAIAAAAIAIAAIANAGGGRWECRCQPLRLLAQRAKHCLWDLIPKARAQAVLRHP